MAKQNNKRYQERKPTIFVAIGYEEIYDDFNTANPSELLDDVPSAAVLKFIAEKYASVFYAQSDAAGQRQHIRDFCPHLPEKIRRKVWNFINRTEKNGNYVFIYGAMGCQMVYRLALQRYIPIEEDDDVDLCEDEYEPVFKALLYCNSVWTNQQLTKGDKKLGDISLKMDMPIAESKHYKDFRPQLYKASQFYSFCEGDETFSTYLPYFLKEKGVNNWGEYITLLFGIYYHSINSSVLPQGNALEQQFLSQFVINVSDGSTAKLWDDGYKGLSYLRDHFLFELPSKEYLMLDANLLIDKLYQGLKFELYKTVKANGLLTSKGKPYKDQPQFNATLGEVFSERHLLYALLGKIYNGGNAVKFTGVELKQNGINAELDYYLRIGNTLFLIEYKDVLFPDNLRYSDKVEDIKQGIKDRLCKDDGVNPRKGGGQLLYNIDRILNHGLMDALDPDVVNVSCIYPLIVTTDSAFSALGVNLTVTEEFDKIMRANYTFNKGVMIYVPVIAHLDSLILLSYRLHKTSLQLNELLRDYIIGNWQSISSFDNYVFDECKETKTEREQGLVFLLGELVNKVALMTPWMKNGIIS